MKSPIIGFKKVITKQKAQSITNLCNDERLWSGQMNKQNYTNISQNKATHKQQMNRIDYALQYIYKLQHDLNNKLEMEQNLAYRVMEHSRQRKSKTVV